MDGNGESRLSRAGALPDQDGRFDHAVLNVHYGLDAAELSFQSMGFKVTPRGYHTLGSINHLIVFDSNYLELLGLDAAAAEPRKELLDWPVGLNGQVYASRDVDAMRQQLQSRGLPVLEAKSFSRPVEVDGARHDARFRTAHLAPGYFPASRLYFCRHFTPELIWHKAFLHHPNSAFALRGIVIAADDPDRQARLLAAAVSAEITSDTCVSAGGVSIAFQREDALVARYGTAVLADGRRPRAAVLRIAVRSIEALKAALAPRWAGRAVVPAARCVILPAEDCFGVMLEFNEEGHA